MAQARVIPPNTICFCWSAEQDRRNPGVVLHLEGVHVGKDARTACGISTAGYWHFNVQDGEPRDWTGCKRCRAVIRATTTEEDR